MSKNLSSKIKLFYIFFFLFFTLYSGVGGSLKTTNPKYLVYYFYYLSFFTLSSYFFNRLLYNGGRINLSSKEINLFISKYANKILLLYIFVNILLLIFPENKLNNLINPPSPDISERLNFYREGAQNSVFNYIKILLEPFFYLSLFKYRHNFYKITIYMLSLLYMEYCVNSYLGRGTIIVTLVILYFIFYYNLSAKRRKLFLISTFVAIPLLILFSVYYSYIRVGEIADKISFSDATLILFSQETNYPELFDSYIKYSGNLIAEYFEWLILLPFPSFLKMGHGETLFNELFTNVSIDRYNWESGFSIALPGIVGEGIFVFKDSLFIHAIILAFIICVTINYVCKYECFLFIYFYVLIKFPMAISRSGTQGVYSIIAKALLFVILINIYINVKNRLRSQI